MNVVNVLGLIVILNSVLVKAEISSKYTVNHYELNAHNLSLLVEKMKKFGPKSLSNIKIWASIKWDLDTEFNYRTEKGLCWLDVQNIEVIAKSQLPQWTNINTVSYSTKEWWKKFYKFLYDHEQLHFNNVLNGAAVLEKSLATMNAFDTCKKTKKEYLRIKNDVLYAIELADFELDMDSKSEFYSNPELYTPIMALTGIRIDSGMIP